MLTVLYDGKCGMCSKEINYYKSIATENIFEWVDVTSSPEVLEKYQLSLVKALKKLHVIDEQGNRYVGADGFIIMWSNIDKWKWLGRFGSLPIIKQIARLIYNGFAYWHFKRLTHCQQAEKENHNQ